MGLFGSNTHHKRVKYGQAETDAMQPWLFNAWRQMQQGGGNPYKANIDMEIQAAYAKAAQEAGQGMAPGAQQAIQADVRNRGGMQGDLLSGQVGMAGQENLLNTAGQASGYLGALTSARPQFSFDPSTPWGDAMGGVKTLMEPASMVAAALQGRPDALGGMSQADPQGLMGPGAAPGNPFAGASTLGSGLKSSLGFLPFF